MALLNWLEATSYSQWILVSAEGWPLMLSLHALGLAIVVGVVFSLNLRMLGLYDTIPYTSLHSLMGVAWIGIWLNIFTGFSIFMAQASSYITNVPFLFKILCIVLGIAILVYTRKILRREAESWEAAGSATRIGTQLAAGSLVFWLLAVITGRLIAYL